ncbi:MAG TPA: homocysteine S-methyltransferase, partial [Propionibacteriaceae bacterium]|nr:homocysteine S-methyltransferase [Propionibacteriaceae bacterium]
MKEAAAHVGDNVRVIIDGGLSNALTDRGHVLADDLWTARLLRDAPEEIVAVHRAYFEAGAEVATTASYQASVGGFTKAGLSTAEAERLIVRSVELAREAASAFPGTKVAASVGPYGAVLGDGSEYRGRYGLSPAALRDFHRPRIELLLSAEPDLLAVETVPDVDEAVVLAELVDEYGVPAWLSYTVADGRTRAGQPLEEAFAVAAGVDAIIATGVNCCAPADVLEAVEIAVATSGKPAIAYPNSGETWD